MSKPTTSYGSTAKNTTAMGVPSDPTTDTAPITKNITAYKASGAFDSAVMLSSTSVTLGSLAVTLLGGISGSFLSDKQSTDTGSLAKPTTGYATP